MTAHNHVTRNMLLPEEGHSSLQNRAGGRRSNHWNTNWGLLVTKGIMSFKTPGQMAVLNQGSQKALISMMTSQSEGMAKELWCSWRRGKLKEHSILYHKICTNKDAVWHIKAQGKNSKLEAEYVFHEGLYSLACFPDLGLFLKAEAFAWRTTCKIVPDNPVVNVHYHRYASVFPK